MLAFSPVRCAALLLVCLAAASLPARAQTTADFVVTGTILPGVCRIAVADVDLGTYQATQFTGAFTTPFVPVNVLVSQCDPLVTSVSLRFDGTADTNSAEFFQGVSGIGIELQDTASGVRLKPGITIRRTTAAGSHSFRVRFAQTAPTVAAGQANRPITVTMFYN